MSKLGAHRIWNVDKKYNQGLAKDSELVVKIIEVSF